MLLLLLFLFVLFYCVDLLYCDSSRRRNRDVHILYVSCLRYWLDYYFLLLLLLFFTIPLPLYHLYTILHNLLISHHLFLTKIKLSLLQMLRLLLMRPILNRIITLSITKNILILHTRMETLIYFLPKPITVLFQPITILFQLVHYVTTLG